MQCDGVDEDTNADLGAGGRARFSEGDDADDDALASADFDEHGGTYLGAFTRAGLEDEDEGTYLGASTSAELEDEDEGTYLGALASAELDEEAIADLGAFASAELGEEERADFGALESVELDEEIFVDFQLHCKRHKKLIDQTKLFCVRSRRTR